MSNQDTRVGGDGLEDDERTDSVPKVSVAYSDEESRDLGERLSALYHARDVDPNPAILEEIARVRSKLRRGPRLHAGEFLQDGKYRLVAPVPTPTSASDAAWQAWERISGDFVLVRVFHGAWVDQRGAIDQFRQRAAALRELQHPNVARVLDAGRSEDGFVFLVTQFVGETSIAELSLDPVDAIQVVVEVAQALGHAHERGVVHGDLRPENVSLSPEGKPYLINFSVEPPSNRMEPSLFHAPEATERGYEPRPTADVYALGMTLLAELNGGSLPFWVLRDPGRLIRSVPVGDNVRAVVQKATEWDLTGRYADLAHLVQDLVADPELVEALARRAQVKGRFEVAAEHYESLLRIQSHRGVEIRTLLGEVYTQVGAFDRAMAHLLAALERTADVESLFGPLRVVASRTGDWARLAGALWTQARARDPGRRVLLRTELARINQDELHNPIAAAETWSQVLADHRVPEQAVTALRALQGLARDRRDWSGFVDYGKELLEYLSEAERPRVEYAIGRAYLEHLGDEDTGLAHIDRAEAGGYDEADLGTRLQSLRAQRGQWRRVIQLMIQQASGQELADASPTLLRAGIIASSVHLEEEAFRVYHALLERAPRHVVALRHLARLHHRAHEADKAARFYERLWETYRGKESEEPEASERAADCTAHATILLRRGRSDEAIERLDEALRLNPNHVPSLELAGPLLLGKGDTARAAVVFDRILSQFKSVELSPQKIGACLGMADLAWVQGRLTAAMGWYNRALELDALCVAAWWGLAKVAMSARGGHPGSDRAPWVMAVPKRFTPQEALARLLCGAVDGRAMRAWLQLTPFGRAVLEAGDSPVRVACSVVDALVRNDLVTPELFQRLLEASPEWSEPIEEVEGLWFGGGAASFTVARSYGWSRRVATHDFDVLGARSVSAPELAAPPVVVEPLRDTGSWTILFDGEVQPAPEPFTMIERPDPSVVHRFAGPVGALVRDGMTWLALGRDRGEALIGSAGSADLQLDDRTLRARHARVFRLAGRVYVENLSDGALQVDGEPRTRWRLNGGERLTIGETRLQYQAYEQEAHLPPPSRILEIGTYVETPAPAPSLNDLPPQVREPEPAPVPPEPPPDELEVVAPSPEEPEPADPESEEPPPAVEASGAAPSEPEPERPPTAEVLPLPAGEPPVALVAGVRMPADVLEPSGPLPSSGSGPELDDEAVDPPSDEELIQVQGRSNAAAPPPVPASDVDDASDEGAPPESGPIDAPVPLVPAAEPAPSEPEVSEPAPSEPAPSEPAPSEPAPSEPAPSEPAPSEPEPGEVEAPTVTPDEGLEAEELPIPEDAPSWLREALLAEASAEDVPEPPAAAEPEPTAEALPEPKAPRPAPVATAPRTPTLSPVSEDSEPYDADSAPTVVQSVVDLRRSLAPPPAAPAPPARPPSAASGFGFPQDVQDDDVESLQPTRRKVPSGLVGPTVAPVERPRAPSAPPAPPRATPPPPVAPPPASPAAPVGGLSPLSAPLRGPPASVEFMSGRDRGRRIVVEEELTVGQGASCGVCIPNDSLLAGVHCRVQRVGDGFRLVDGGSPAGTVVNGQRVSQIALTGGEVIMVGRTVLRFRVDP